MTHNRTDQDNCCLARSRGSCLVSVPLRTATVVPEAYPGHFSAAVSVTKEFARDHVWKKNYTLGSILFKMQWRIFQRNGLKLDKDFIFLGLAQNVYVYRMAKSKKIWPFRFYAINFLSWEKNAWALTAAP